MQISSLTIPSKTFILGEYAILAQQPALLVATSPTCRVELNSKYLEPFHPESPAGSYYKQHLHDKKIGLELIIPKSMRNMGLGVSGAEWLAAYLIKAIDEKIAFSMWDKTFWTDCLASYHAHQGNMATPGSGADWLCQMLGGYIYYQPKQKVIHPTQWPFDDYGWILVHTGQKCQTHKHLNQIDDIQSFSTWGTILDQAWNCWAKKDSKGFSEQVLNYHEQLLLVDKVAHHTRQMLNVIQPIQGVECAKGCGAMGADTIWLMCQREAIPEIKYQLNQKAIHIIADDTHVHEGLQWETS